VKSISEDYDKAIDILNKAVALAPKDPDALNARAITYFFAGKVDKALLDFKAQLTLQPNNSELAVSCANCYRNMNDHENAQRYYGMAIKLNPQEGRSYGGSGFDYSLQNKMDKALWYVQQITATPQEEAIYDASKNELRLANVYLSTGKKETALELGRKVESYLLDAKSPHAVSNYVERLKQCLQFMQSAGALHKL